MPYVWHEKQYESGMDNTIKISVSLCTYNGEQFLQEQLDSIAAQTKLPNEVIICDDASTDKTIEILENFKEKANFDVKIFQNETPLRVTKNFEKAIENCKGEFIFLADQDDFWLPQKIERMVTVLEENGDLDLLFSDAELVTEHLEKLGKTQFQTVRFFEKQQHEWLSGGATKIMLGGNRITGCTVAFRKKMLENNVLPFPTHIPDVIHDTWLAWVATVRHRCSFLPEALTYYRQHEGQQIGSRPRNQGEIVGWKERFSRPREEKLAPFLLQKNNLETLYVALLNVKGRENELQEIKKRLDFFSMRSHLPRVKFARFPAVINHLLKGNYHAATDQEASWKAPWMAMVGDLLE